MDGEPLAVGIAEHGVELVEIHRLERRDDVLGGGVDAGRREVVRGVGLRAVARLVERDHGRGRTDVVVDDLDFRIALLEGGEFRGPVGPSRAGVEAHHHAFLLRGVVERLLTGVELRRIEHGLRGRERGEHRCAESQQDAA